MKESLEYSVVSRFVTEFRVGLAPDFMLDEPSLAGGDRLSGLDNLRCEAEDPQCVDMVNALCRTGKLTARR